MERVGETVVSVLGLDDSHFQDVIDGMTEEEMERARQVQAEREAEFERVRSIRELRQQNTDGLVTLEEGASHSPSTAEASPVNTPVVTSVSVEDISVTMPPIQPQQSIQEQV